MSVTLSTLMKSLVKPFYRQNAGLFIFLIIVMFGAVGQVDQHDTLDYHYALIKGMLSNKIFFLLVLFVWFLYASKCFQFVTKTLQRPEYSFLNILCQTGIKNAYIQLLLVQLTLFLPVFLYSLAIITVAVSRHLYLKAIIVFLYNAAICMVNARLNLLQLYNAETSFNTSSDRVFKVFTAEKLYWMIFIHYLLNNRRLLLFSIKLYDCAILYLFMRNVTQQDYDITLGLIFYSFGLLGHGVLIHQLRYFEEQKLIFYRGLPVSLFRRFVQYATLYFVLLLPEIVTIVWLAAKYLHLKDAIEISLFSYSLLLFLNSLLFVSPYKMRDYLKTCLGIFCIVWTATFFSLLIWLLILFFSLSIYLFFVYYYNYEMNDKVSLTYRS